MFARGTVEQGYSFITFRYDLYYGNKIGRIFINYLRLIAYYQRFKRFLFIGKHTICKFYFTISMFYILINDMNDLIKRN